MKTILIEAVSNGWVVSLRDACREGPLAVYNHIADLQAALPALLGAVQEFIAAPTYEEIIPWLANLNITKGVNPPPLADRDSEGGNTGL